MTERRVLYLTQHQMLAYRWRSGTLSAEREFVVASADDTFTRYLVDHTSSIFALVVNLGEEGFQSEVIPFLQSGDRNAVIARRLGQSFLGTPLAVAISHGHESGTRKNERLLLTALTGTTQLEPWLAAIRSCGARLQGIYSLPLLTEGLVHKLGLGIARGILITIQDSTIRQSFFNGGHLLFSRVAPLIGSSVSDLALSVATEANRFQQYLLSQRMVARGDRLSAHALAPAQAISAIRMASFNEGIDLTVHDLAAAARKVGLKIAPADGRAQTLFLHCAFATPPRQQFANATMRQPYRFWQMGNAFRAVGGLFFAGCLLFSVKLHVDVQRANADTAQRLAEAASKEQSYREALGRLPPIPLSNDVLRQLYDRVQQLGKRRDTPDIALHHLASALDATPQVELASLTWSAPGVTENRSTDTAPKNTPLAAETKESLLVKGHLILRPVGTPRLLVSTFDDFTRRLREVRPEASITVVQTPIDLTAGRALKSAESTASAQAPRQFALLIEYPGQP